LASSTGIALARQGTSIQLGFFCIVKQSDGKVGSFYDFDEGRSLADIEPQHLAANAAKRARDYLGGEKIGSTVTTLVLGPLSSFDLMSCLANAANAESIQRRRSVFTGRLGQQVASPQLTLIDDGLVAGGMHSAPYDSEGAKRKVVTVIDAGRFAAQLHNSYTANKAKVDNTGHGTRRGGVGHTNLRVKLGDKTAEQLISEVDDGLYLELGSLAPDPVSGDISTNLDFARRIKRGRLTYPVANAMVAGNLLQLLKNIDAVSSDCRIEPGNTLPTIRIRDVHISAAKEPQ